MAEEAYDWRFFLAAGLGLWIASEALELVGTGPAVHAGLVGLFLAVLGGLCLRNWRACGARHCGVTGPAYLLLAVGAWWVAAVPAPFTLDAVWLGFALVVAVGVGTSLLEPPAAEA